MVLPTLYPRSGFSGGVQGGAGAPPGPEIIFQVPRFLGTLFLQGERRAMALAARRRRGVLTDADVVIGRDYFQG